MPIPTPTLDQLAAIIPCVSRGSTRSANKHIIMLCFQHPQRVRTNGVLLKVTARQWSIPTIRLQVFGKDEVSLDEVKYLLRGFINSSLALTLIPNVIVNVRRNVEDSSVVKFRRLLIDTALLSWSYKRRNGSSMFFYRR